MNMKQQRLIQALKYFNSTTRGEELPKGVAEAVAALTEALSQPAPANDTPGARRALKVATGTTGTGEPFNKAAKGVDGPSPGQTEAKGISDQIREAAEAIVAQSQK